MKPVGESNGKQQKPGGILAGHGAIPWPAGSRIKRGYSTDPQRFNLWQNLRLTPREPSVNTYDVNYSRLPVGSILEQYFVNSK